MKPAVGRCWAGLLQSWLGIMEVGGRDRVVGIHELVDHVKKVNLEVLRF